MASRRRRETTWWISDEEISTLNPPVNFFTFTHGQIHSDTKTEQSATAPSAPRVAVGCFSLYIFPPIALARALSIFFMRELLLIKKT